ncbi:MAG: hypothetical protein BWY80_01431 [Firmicutes bacterium ADurb.Bin456]|nr:MAG: hypothetical protein BWY80_01431 [Firmicutes bacterium ADurb.Bin456]
MITLVIILRALQHVTEYQGHVENHGCTVGENTYSALQEGRHHPVRSFTVAYLGQRGKGVVLDQLLDIAAFQDAVNVDPADPASHLPD